MQAGNRNFKNEVVSTRMLLFPDIPLRASLGTIARWSCAACRQFNERSSGGVAILNLPEKIKCTFKD